MKELEQLATELGRKRITRLQFFERAVGAGIATSAIATVLAACGGSDEAAPDASPAPMDTTKPDELLLFNWEYEIAPSNKKKFEQQTGIKVVETYYDDNESLLAKLKGGATGYDVIVPSSYMVSILRKSGFLEALDMSYIPNFKNILPKFQKPVYDPETDGAKYSVPYLWGTTGIAVRTDLVDEPITSWAQLWDEKYKGKINMLNDERETLGAALKLLGFSLNTETASEIEAAGEKLIEQKPLVRQYDSLALQRNIIQGVPLCHMWNGNANDAIIQLGEDKVSYVLPSEGYTIWVDNLCLPTGASSRYGAHLFMDFMSDGVNAAELVNFVKYLSPNAAATPDIDPFIIAHTPSEADLERGELVDDVGQASRTYTDTWAKVKSS
jgi:spermidine/putrescine transport system substrate-binding protein